MLHTSRRPFAAVVVTLTLTACALACSGVGTQSTSSDGGPEGGPAGSDAGPDAACMLKSEPAGAPFTFKVTNTGTKALYLGFGCGETPPVTIVSAGGAQPISSRGTASSCDSSCDSIDGQEHVCSDCGPGVAKLLKQGQTVTIAWDRRTYAPASPSCSCTLGRAVTTGSIEGTLGVCDLGDFPTNTPLGECSPTQTIPFAADLTKNELAIEVK